MVTKSGLQPPPSDDPSASRRENGAAQATPPTEENPETPKDGETEPEQDKIDPVHLAWIEFSPGFREKLRGVQPPVIPPEELFDTMPPNQTKRGVSRSEALPAGEAPDAKVPGLTTTELILSRPLDAKLRYVAAGALFIALAFAAWWVASSGPSRAPSNAATSSAQTAAVTPPVPTQQIVAPQPSTAATVSSTGASATPGTAAVQSAAATSRPAPSAAHPSRSTSAPSASPRTASPSTDPNWIHLKE